MPGWIARLALEDWQQIAQISFYLFTAGLALLTYRSAKRGLLNTVNTEYQKRAMDRIQQLSDELLAEFDMRSPTFWHNDWQFEGYVRPVFEAAASARKMGIPVPGMVPESKSLARLRHIEQRVTSDPFLPREVRTVVLSHLRARLSVLFGAWGEVFQRYVAELNEGKHGISLSTDAKMIGQWFLDVLRGRGQELYQFEEDVHEVRLALQAYLESYNPFPGRRVKGLSVSRRIAGKRAVDDVKEP